MSNNQLKSQDSDYVVAPGRSVLTAGGILEQNESIDERHITGENKQDVLKALVKKGAICLRRDYQKILGQDLIDKEEAKK